MMQTKVPFFPAPLKDETIFSLVIRFNILSGNHTIRDSYKALFGQDTFPGSSVIPYCLGTLACQSSIPLHHLRDNHTLFQFYRTFMSPLLAVDFALSIAGDRKPRKAHSIKLPRGTNYYWRYCPLCADHDLELYGFSYWRRSHQLPGVLVCQTHSVMLEKFKYLPYVNGQFLTKLPHQTKNTDMREIIKVDPDNRLLKYAELCKQLLFAGGHLYGSFALRLALSQGLHDRGFINGGGGLRLQKYRDELLNVYGEEVLRAVTYGSKFCSVWAGDIFPHYTKIETGNAITYMLIIGLCFNNINEFLKACQDNMEDLLRPSTHNSLSIT